MPFQLTIHTLFVLVTALGASELHQPQHIMIDEVRQKEEAQAPQPHEGFSQPSTTATEQYLQDGGDQHRRKAALTSGEVLPEETVLQQGTIVPEGAILPKGSVIVPTADGSLLVTDGQHEEQTTFSQTSTSVIQAEQQIPESLLVNDDVTAVALDHSKASLATFITQAQQQSSEEGQIISFDPRSEQVVLEHSGSDENADTKTSGDTIIIATIEKKTLPNDTTNSEEITADTTVHVTIEKREQLNESELLVTERETTKSAKMSPSVKAESKEQDVVNGTQSEEQQSKAEMNSKISEDSDTDVKPPVTRSGVIKPKRQLITRFKRKQQKKTPSVTNKVDETPKVVKGTRKSVRKGVLPKKLSDSIMPAPKRERTTSESKVEIELNDSEKELFKKTKEELEILNNEAAEGITQNECKSPNKKLKMSRTRRTETNNDMKEEDETGQSKEERKFHRVECMLCSSMLRDYAGVHDHLKSRHAEHPDFEKHLQEAKVD